VISLAFTDDKNRQLQNNSNRHKNGFVVPTVNTVNVTEELFGENFVGIIPMVASGPVAVRADSA
jgi:hypothetical protein